MRSRYVVEVVEESVPPAAPVQPVQQAPPQAPVVPSTPVIEPPKQSPSLPVGGLSQIKTQPTVVEPKVTHQPLRAKVNAAVSLPQRKNVSPDLTQSTEPVDMFAAAQPSFHLAWQHVEMKSAQEVPEVRPPKSAKQKRIVPETIKQNQTSENDRMERIERLFTPHSIVGNDQSKSFSAKKTKPWQPMLKKPKKWVIGLVICALFCLGSATAVGAMVQYDISQAKLLVKDLERSIEEGNFVQASDSVAKLGKKQRRYKSLYTFVRPVLAPIIGKEKAKNLDSLWVVSDRGLDVANEAFATYDTASIAYAQFIGKTPGSAIATSASLSGQLESVYSGLSGLQAEMAGLDNPFDWEVVETLKKQSQTTLPSARRSVLASQQLVPVLPTLLGLDGKKQYLILLQNNSELRPTGGFIGSIGILTVENGSFVDFRVEDVYEADGQLNGFVEPPAELKKYLGEAQWYLRDVNWAPDFPTVAEQASWFLDKTIGIKPDGVIGINLSVAQQLLKSTGPITLVDYNEVITADNLYERAQLHSEVNFFPGSSQKKDFLSAVATALFQKLMEGQGSTAKIIPALYKSAQESQVLVSMKNPSEAMVFRSLGWDGGVLTPDCPPPFSQGSCVVDTVMQVEANVGVNKSNQFVNRDIHHVVQVTDTAAIHTRTVTLQNTSTSNAWPQGAYKAYFRLFVSPRATLTSISVNGQNMPLEEITQQQEFGKQSFGVLVNVPVKSSSVVELSYSVPLDAGWNSYALFEQKQSGTGTRSGGDVMTHEFDINSSGRVVTIAPEPDSDLSVDRLATGVAEAEKNPRYIFESNRTTHEFMAIEVAR